MSRSARRRCAARVTFSLLAVFCAGTVRAQSRVRLGEPSCDRLPFDPASVRRLVALELRLSQTELCSEGGACEPDATVAYELEPCALGATDFIFVVSDPRGDRREHVTMAEVPLGALPRAIALGLVESLRGGEMGADEVDPHAVETDAVDPHAVALQATESGPDPPPEVTPTAQALLERRSEPPEPPAVQQGEAPTPPIAQRQVCFGVHAVLQNTPDTGAVLLGTRLVVELPIAELPLVLRADVAAGVGPAAGDVVLAAVDGGLTLAIWAPATEDLGLRFGPRLWLGYVGWLSPGDVTRETELEVLFGLGLRLGIDLRMTDEVDLVVEAAVGSHVHGAQLSRGAVRTGLLGAYWALEVGLAFD